MKKLIIAAIITVMAAGVFTGCSDAGGQLTNTGRTGVATQNMEKQSTETEKGQSVPAQTQNTTGGQNAAGQNTADTTVQNNTAAGQGDIGQDAALKTALDAAGVSEADITRLQVSEDRDDGRKVYDIRFDVGQTEYNYEIQASDGQIFNSDVENSGRAAMQNGQGSANVAVSREEAAATALAQVPGATENDIRLELDYDDGRQKYDGNIIYNQMEYEFEIDANSGEILSWSEERP